MIFESEFRTEGYIFWLPSVLLNGKNLATTHKLDACNLVSSAETVSKIVLWGRRLCLNNGYSILMRVSVKCRVWVEVGVHLFLKECCFKVRVRVLLTPC